MSTDIHETEIQGYPELAAEAAEVEETQNSDARPVSSQPNDWNISTIDDPCHSHGGGHGPGRLTVRPGRERQFKHPFSSA